MGVQCQVLLRGAQCGELYGAQCALRGDRIPEDFSETVFMNTQKPCRKNSLSNTTFVNLLSTHSLVDLLLKKCFPKDDVNYYTWVQKMAAAVVPFFQGV